MSELNVESNVQFTRLEEDARESPCCLRVVLAGGLKNLHLSKTKERFVRKQQEEEDHKQENHF